MRKLALLLLALPLCVYAEQRTEALYGKAYTAVFEMYDSAGLLDLNEVDAGTEVQYRCLTATETVSVATAADDDFTDAGKFYTILLTAAEMKCKVVILEIGATLDHVLIIETYGHALAQKITRSGEYRYAAVVDATGTTTSTDLVSTASSTTDAYVPNILSFYDASADEYYEAVCTAYNGTSKVCTHTAIPAAMVSGDSVTVQARTGIVITTSNGVVDSNITAVAANAMTNAGLADGFIGANEFATGAFDANALAADAATEIGTASWNIICEDQGSTYTCRELLSILLAEAAGTAVYTSGTRTWVVKDPSGTETRLTIIYGAELDGDRTTSTPAPMTP